MKRLIYRVLLLFFLQTLIYADEEGLPAVDQQQQIDVWKARHAGGTAYRGDGEKVEIEVRLPTRVVYTKPTPPPGGGGGGGDGDGKPKGEANLECNTDSNSNSENTVNFDGVWKSIGHPYYDYSGAGCDIKTPCGKYIASMISGESVSACGKTLTAGAKRAHGTGWIFGIKKKKKCYKGFAISIV